MPFASIVYDMFAAFGCMSATFILLVLTTVLLAARVGAAPVVAGWLKRLAERPSPPPGESQPEAPRPAARQHPRPGKPPEFL